jgi:YebC/PmpR family DNA-binding regulatory protein
LLIESLTDIRNRTVAELRHIFSRNGGNLAETGAVGWNFERKGIIYVPKGKYPEDDLMTVILEAGADDMNDEGDYYEVKTSIEGFESVRKSIESAGYKIDNASLQYVAKTTTKVEGKDAEQVLKLISALEDNDDVQNVYSNADIDEKIMEIIS